MNKKFNYSVLIPPLSKEIKDLNADEANEFFKWYQTESKIQGWRIQKYTYDKYDNFQMSVLYNKNQAVGNK